MERFSFRSVFILSAAALMLPSLAWSEGKATPADAKDSSVSPDSAVEAKAAEWATSLNLGDAQKEKRVAGLISTHLQAVRGWHNAHPFTTVPEGVNPATGKPLSQLDREVIADSALPKSVHQALMTGLRSELTEAQVEAVLDKYTVGKVAFTLTGYKAIVPDLTAQEEATILGFLKQAREEAIDYKNMKEISAVFEVYKTKSEQYLNANGRNWKELYKVYTAAAKARKLSGEHPAK